MSTVTVNPRVNYLEIRINRQRDVDEVVQQQGSIARKVKDKSLAGVHFLIDPSAEPYAMQRLPETNLGGKNIYAKVLPQEGNEYHELKPLKVALPVVEGAIKGAIAQDKTKAVAPAVVPTAPKKK